MSELILFCSPGDLYKGKVEEQVAKQYKKFAIDDYDELIEFESDYDPLKPDYIARLNPKEDRDLILTIFFNQPMIKIGNLSGKFFSSSYLFNPKSDSGLSLPDLDVVQIGGKGNVNLAMENIKQLYEKNKWKVYVHEGDIRKMVVPAGSSRFEGSIEIMYPGDLIGIAKEKLNYNSSELCF
jgi:hypothetical protein